LCEKGERHPDDIDALLGLVSYTPKASAPTLPSSPVAAASRSFPQLATHRGAHQRYGDALPGEPITSGLAAGRHTVGVPIQTSYGFDQAGEAPRAFGTAHT
jgi:hypothetical protein